MQNYQAGFQNVDSISDRMVLSTLDDNIKSFLDWSFINIGGFINASSVNNSTYTTLSHVEDPTFAAGRVWSTPKKDWIYETGINFNGNSPINISGIELNGTFLPSPTGLDNYSYQLNYPDGRLEFDSPVNTSSVITMSYSYRRIQVYKSNSQKWFIEISPDILSQNRVDLPAVLIEPTPRTIQLPYEIGNKKNRIIQDVLLHVIAANPTERSNISQMLLAQKDKFFKFYNIDKVVADGLFPLNFYGNTNPTRINYDILMNMDDYILRNSYIKDASITDIAIIAKSIYHCVVRWSLEIFP